ncbi:MAG: hypothetical protein GX638_11865 [Crenarchaeota archaeon]|nr:hypothetical protein [Thermoproteota archaeon]
MGKVVTIYDGSTLKRLAYLQNSFDVKYEKNINSLWTAEFKLPYSDPKRKYCDIFNYAEIWDIDSTNKDRYVGLFRIMPTDEEIIGTAATATYKLEHVFSTLLDDVMIGFHEIGNTGVTTAQVINYILQNQTTERWKLERCDYTNQYLYGWQDENLLSALFSVVKPFSETDYYWDFNTKVYPWRLSLKRTNATPVTDIRYKKNLNGLARTIDPSSLTTRLYCYGYGDGDNKLGIEQVNNGKPYLDSPNIAQYGVITQIWTDESQTIAQSLKNIGEAMLRQLEVPKITYHIDIQAIYAAANLNIGDTIRIVSDGLDELMTVRQFAKDDVTGAPNSGTIILGVGTVDIADSVAELAEKQRISETYSQGSESIFMDSFTDNADSTNPAEVTFRIPNNVVHVNEILFSCKLTSFRAYSKAIQGGGAVTKTTSDGGETNVTSSSGGLYTSSSSGGGSATITSTSGGNFIQTTQDGGGGTISSYGGGSGTATSVSAGSFNQTIGVYNVLPTDDNIYRVHNHGIPKGTRLVTSLNVYKNSSGYVTDVTANEAPYGYSPSGDHEHYININSHSHDVALPSHTHYVGLPAHSHYISVSGHTHSVSIPEHKHTISVPNHTHNVYISDHSHEISLPNHTHNIEYGIYKGPSASSIQVYLDDTNIGSYSGTITDLNLISYMSKDANGHIMRGNHTIKIIPNALTRIECTFQIRLFTNALGSGQY